MGGGATGRGGVGAGGRRGRRRRRRRRRCRTKWAAPPRPGCRRIQSPERRRVRSAASGPTPAWRAAGRAAVSVRFAEPGFATTAKQGPAWGAERDVHAGRRAIMPASPSVPESASPPTNTRDPRAACERCRRAIGDFAIGCRSVGHNAPAARRGFSRHSRGPSPTRGIVPTRDRPRRAPVIRRSGRCARRSAPRQLVTAARLRRRTQLEGGRADRSGGSPRARCVAETRRPACRGRDRPRRRHESSVDRLVSCRRALPACREDPVREGERRAADDEHGRDTTGGKNRVLTIHRVRLPVGGPLTFRPNGTQT